MAERNRFCSVADFQQALAESENRRKVLLQTIQETQETIRVQGVRLDETEQLTKERQKELDKVKNKERDYQRYITNLERQLLIGKQRQEGQLKILEDAENKLELLEEEASTLSSSVARLQGECKHKEDKLKACSSRIKELEEENASLVVELESANQTLLVQLESLASLREDNAFLDKQAKSEAMDAERLRKENTSLCSDVKQLRKQATTFGEKSSLYVKEISLLTTQLQASNIEEKRLKSQVSELQKINNELKDVISSFTSEKDRFFREKLEFCAQIQNLAIEKDTLFRERLLADDEANELSSDLARTKRMANKLVEENKCLTEKLNEIRKVHDSLSFDVLNARYKPDQQRDQMHSTEQRKGMTFQQDDLYEDEIRSLEQQLFDCQKMLKAANQEKDWALTVRDELIAKLQNEVTKLREEKHNLEWILEIQRDVSEAEIRQQKLEYLCKCHGRSGKESSEDVCDHRSRNEGSEDFRVQFDGCPRQEDTSAYNFAAVHSSHTNISQNNEQPMQTLSSEKEEPHSSNVLVEDIFCESWYAETNKSLVLSSQLTPECSDQHVPSQFNTTEIESKYGFPAYDRLGLEATDFNENRALLADREKVGENAAITDLCNDGGSRVKDTAEVKDERRVEMIPDLKAIFCLDGEAEHLQMNNLEKDDYKDGPNESIPTNSLGTKDLKQEDAVKLEEENSKMEIYVCVADDQDEKFFEEGSAAFLVLLPPNSKDLSVISDNAGDLEHQGNGVADNCVTGEKNDSKSQTNLPSGENIVENKACTPDIQVYRLTSNDNETFRNRFVGQNVSEEPILPGTPMFGAIEPSTSSKNFASALANENIQLPTAAKDKATSQTDDDNKASISKDTLEVGVQTDSRKLEENVTH